MRLSAKSSKAEGYMNTTLIILVLLLIIIVVAIIAFRNVIKAMLVG
jgi:hypothetical protein